MVRGPNGAAQAAAVQSCCLKYAVGICRFAA